MWQVVVFLLGSCNKNILLPFVEQRLIITWQFSHQASVASHGSSLWIKWQSFLALPIQMLGMHFPDELQLSLRGLHPHL